MLADICQYPPSRELAASMMRETQQVAHTLGIDSAYAPVKLLARAMEAGQGRLRMEACA